MEININPEDIDKLVKTKIMESAFGKAIEGSVKAALKIGSYNSPIDQEMSRTVTRMAREVIEEELGTKIKGMVRTIIMQTVTDQVLQKVTEKVADAIVKAYNDR